VIHRYWLPTIRAAVETDRKNAAKAIELLKIAAPVETAQPEPQLENGGTLYPAYVRGLAYLLLKDGNAAAAEFQKFQEYRGVVLNHALGALARLGLARAYLLAGDKARARSAYEAFLTLWKDADPDIPVLKQAKTEYASLGPAHP